MSTTDPTPTPYDDPTGLFDRITFPALAHAYRQGTEDADDLGVTAMKLGVRDAAELIRMVQFYHLAQPRLVGALTRFQRELVSGGLLKEAGYGIE